MYARLWEAFEDWLDNSDDISDISKFASDLSSYWEMVNMRNSVSGENETRNAVMVSLDKVATVEEMLPYLVAAGHMKYTACVPQYITAMKSLPASVERVSNGELYEERKGSLIVFGQTWH